MGEYINKRTLIDSETGEILKENNWIGYDGFGKDGYKYRNKAVHIRYYFDAIPPNITEESYTLLMMIAELANDHNVLVRRVERKSKFSTIIYKPLDKEEIREMTRFKYGINKFDRCWRELTKKCIKRIDYYDYKAWAINPAIMNKCKFVPFWLYNDFKEYMNPYLSATTIKKLENKTRNY